MSGKSGGSGDSGHDNTGAMRWLLTYADLITLLMVFFVVMYAISNVDAAKYKALAHSLGEAFSRFAPAQQSSALSPAVSDAGASSGILDGQTLEQFASNISEYVQEKGLQSEVRVRLEERGLAISLVGSVMFDLGRAEIRSEGLQIIDKVADYLANTKNYVSVEGSTDDLPVNTYMYPTNWELSVHRAVNVVRYLVEKRGLSPARFIASGYGEFRPLYPNDSEQNRAKNRRVDIVILRPRGEAQGKSQGDLASVPSALTASGNDTGTPVHQPWVWFG